MGAGLVPPFFGWGADVDYLDWTIRPIALNPKWAAVKDLRLPKDTCPSKSMQGIHDWTLDRIQWRHDGQFDDWSKPGDTLARGHGDCEDICIVERCLMLNAGYRDRDIELMIVRDIAAKADHALLWVKQHYVDNRHAGVQHISQFIRQGDYWPLQAHKGDGSYSYVKRR